MLVIAWDALWKGVRSILRFQFDISFPQSLALSACDCSKCVVKGTRTRLGSEAVVRSHSIRVVIVIASKGVVGGVQIRFKITNRSSRPHSFGSSGAGDLFKGRRRGCLTWFKVTMDSLPFRNHTLRSLQTASTRVFNVF